MVLFIFFVALLCGSLSFAEAQKCDKIKPRPFTTFYDVDDISCERQLFANLSKVCTKDGFLGLSNKKGESFVIIYGNQAGIRYICIDDGKVKIDSCASPEGFTFGSWSNNELALDDKGLVMKCTLINNKDLPYMVFNNRQECVSQGGYMRVKVGKSSETGEYNCTGDGYKRARLERVGCRLSNGTLLPINSGPECYLCEIEGMDISGVDPDSCSAANTNVEGKYTLDDQWNFAGKLVFKCVSKKLSRAERLRYFDFMGQPELVGCIEKGKMVKPGKKLAKTGKECVAEYCEVEGKIYMVGERFTDKPTELAASAYECVSDKGKASAKFIGCQVKDGRIIKIKESLRLKNGMSITCEGEGTFSATL